jgi:periplasmic divalent cation tolerance protein
VTVAETPVVVLTTLGSPDAARDLVRRLVEDRLVACGTVVPGATSIYRWQGAVTTDSEVLIVLKTVRGRWDALAAAVDRHHPYDTPELVALPVDVGLPRYVEWLTAQTAEFPT